MKVWLFRASELMPIGKDNDRLLRMGLLAEELVNNKHKVTWFASDFDHFKKKHICNEDTIVKIKDNYNIYLIHGIAYKKNISVSRIINHKQIGIKLKRKIEKLEKPDIIIASYPTIEFAKVAVDYGRKHNIPVIIDIRDLWPDTFKQNLTGIVKKLSVPYVNYLNRIAKNIMKNAYAITSISDSMLSWGLEKGKRKKTNKDKVFYIGYKNNKNKEIIECKNIDKSKFNVCFFATINNQFNYDLVINTAKLLEKENIEFLICGLGPNLPKFKEKAKNIKNIKFLGWQDKDELNYILSNSKIGFAPYKDTFDFRMSVSNKFAEYISYGLPIIISSTGYMKELIEENKIGLSSANPKTISKYIIKVKQDEKLYKELSNNSLKLYKNNFDADVIYKEFNKYLEKIVKEYEK